MSTTKLYRYEVSHCEKTTAVGLYEFDVIKETPHKWAIALTWDKTTLTYVAKVSKKKYAYPTKEEAALNFKLRSEKYLRLLEHKISVVKESLLFDLSKADTNG